VIGHYGNYDLRFTLEILCDYHTPTTAVGRCDKKLQYTAAGHYQIRRKLTGELARGGQFL
jgi:hypothetical protein